MSLSPHRLLVGWGTFQRKTQQEITSDQPAFYISDFFLTDKNPWLQFLNWGEFSNEEFLDLLEPMPKSATCSWVIHNPDQFRSAFYELLSDLKIDRMKKAVPYLFAHSSSMMTIGRLKNSLKKGLLSIKQNAGSLYGHWNRGRGVVGVTPERLFYHSTKLPKIVQTMALAGTCHSSYSKEAFTKSTKEQHEHEFVVQGICESSKKFGVPNVGHCHLLKLPRLTHLVTPIEIELYQRFCFDNLVRDLHPTPALGALPLKEGKKWLAQFEEHTPRECYGNPLGFIYPQKGVSLCLIGIRNVQWNESGMRIGAGCGVIKESLFDKELQEILFKIRAIRNQLHL